MHWLHSVWKSTIEAPLEDSKPYVQEKLHAEGGAIRKGSIAQIVDVRNFGRVKGLFDDAVAKGATIAVGGTLEEADLTIHPAMLTDVTPDMKILQEELSAPVLPVMTYDTLDDGIA